MNHLKDTFQCSQKQGRPLLVTYVTAGLPSVAETPDIMLGMQAGGSGESPLAVRKAIELIDLFLNSKTSSSLDYHSQTRSPMVPRFRGPT